MSTRLNAHTGAWAALAAAALAVQAARADVEFARPVPDQGPKRQVRASILADVTAVRPARPFALGVLLEMKPGWHVYWKNPGDAGLATQIDFKLPQGFSAGGLNWPVPVRFDQPGDIVGYGYEKRVLLWSTITPPKKLTAHSSVRLEADVSWLACKGICVPGEAKLKLKMPVAGAGDKGEGESADVFARWRKRLPADVASAGRRVSAKVAGKLTGRAKAGEFEIVLEWKGPPPDEVRWFPGPVEGAEIKDASVRPAGRRTRISFSARALPGAKHTTDLMESLVVYTGADGERRAVSVPMRLGGPKDNPRAGKKRTDAKEGERDKQGPETIPMTKGDAT